MFKSLLSSTFVMLFFFSNYSFAKNKFYIIDYYTQKGDTLVSVYKLVLKDSAKLSKSHPAVVMTYKKNSWLAPKMVFSKGQELKLYVLASEVDKSKYLALKEKQKANSIVYELENYSGPAPFDGAKFSLYYMYFLGSMTQSGSGGEVSFRERGIITLGSQGNYYFPHSPHSIAAGLSVTKLNLAKSNLDYEIVNFPLESSAYLHGEYLFKKSQSSFHYGLDYENISSFDLNETSKRDEIVLDKTSFIYASVGASKAFNFFNTSLFAKLLISTPISSSSKTENSYKGQRIILNLQKKFHKRYFIYTHLKYFNFSDKDKLNGTRVGLGGGLLF